MDVGVHGACTLPGRLDALADARTWATTLGEQAGLSPRQQTDLALLVTEAMSNIVRHGYGGDDIGEVELALDAEGDRIELVIRDRAPWWDGTVRPQDEGGYGLGLIDQLAQEVERRPREGGGTELRMVVAGG